MYKCSFSSVKKTQFESLFTNYSLQNKIVTKPSIINVFHVFLIVILNLFLK
ncbi:radical SAM domain-containing protein [Listeria seeligeri FSL S4-171]|nr:radical SAM domain-containing protein [Listeria seeligeri FSL S4-171]